MLTFWQTWLDATRFALDAQCVVTLRMLRLAAGGPQATAEAQRMVMEKIAAFTTAQIAGGAALASGSGLAVVGARAAAPYRRRLRANRRRLTRQRG
jgi:hypothetical protein